MVDAIWEITVAIAAPRTPRPSAKIKIGSKRIFVPAPINIENIAILGFPSLRIEWFNPKLSILKIVPIKIICIYWEA